ncbi:MAG: hypothetical protein AB4352_15870 [Hormoscilla sp.]
MQALEDEVDEKAKGYYYNGELRIESSQVGSDHARDHAMIICAIWI